MSAKVLRIVIDVPPELITKLDTLQARLGLASHIEVLAKAVEALDVIEMRGGGRFWIDAGHALQPITLRERERS